MADDKYCYPKSDVLINKLNIHDAKTLSDAEREITARVAAALRTQPLKGDFDFTHLSNIHKILFSRLYDWAGKQRTVDIGKGVQFASVQFLKENTSKIFGDLKRDNYLIAIPYDKAMEKLAYYLGEINVLHPFREGNGRTQRLFITYLAQATGITLDFSKCDNKRMLEASMYSAIAADNTKFVSILKEISNPITLVEQREFLQSISTKALSVFDSKNVQDRTRELETVKEKPLETMSDWKSQIAKMRENGNAPNTNLKDKSGREDR